jgi:hypothetical protein
VLPSVVSLSLMLRPESKQRPRSSSERTVGEHTIADIAERFSAWSSFRRWACRTPSKLGSKGCQPCQRCTGSGLSAPTSSVDQLSTTSSACVRATAPIGIGDLPLAPEMTVLEDKVRYLSPAVDEEAVDVSEVVTVRRGHDARAAALSQAPPCPRHLWLAR